MRKVVKFKNTAKQEFVIRGGVKYQVIDLGGSKMEIRVKSDDEIKRDNELFRLKLKCPF
mgnify:CR=1 FL=1|jgi:hypothetical protein|tara:strand:- start:261 stop:437 length:177 start_codon:yes stop_codon:yes gene_type:complete